VSILESPILGVKHYEQRGYFHRSIGVASAELSIFAAQADYCAHTRTLPTFTQEIEMSGIVWSHIGSLQGLSRRCDIEAFVGTDGGMTRFIPRGLPPIEIGGLFPDLEAAREAASSSARAFFKRQGVRK
jgi:hypothetical protein